MKISVKNIVLSALLALAVGIFLPAFEQSQKSAYGAAYGQNASAHSDMDVTGTTWAGTDSDGDYYEYTFEPKGVLHYKSPSGFFTDGTWQQYEDEIYMQTYLNQTAKKYSERMGQITGTHMQGYALNITGRRWSWVADKK
jgi:hypothetical protein